MIQYNPKSWFSLIFHTYSRQVMCKLLPAMLAVSVLTAVVCWIELNLLDEPLNLSNSVHSLLGFVLSLFLVFRTNTAYDRWWEGRKQWGALVNVSRTLAVRVREFGSSDETKSLFQSHIPAFVESLRDHLRTPVVPEPSAPIEDAFSSSNHAPNAWAQSMERQASKALSEGLWSSQQHWLVFAKSRTHGGHFGRMRGSENSDSIQLQHVHEEVYLLVCHHLADWLCGDVRMVVDPCRSHGLLCACQH